MDLSTSELFHFTDFKYLKMILESKSFLPRYNLEYTHLSDSYVRPAALIPIPMVCFCDIPLQLSAKHRDRYGATGISMKESWKLKNGLNPIIYIQSESELAHVFSYLSNIGEVFVEQLKNKPEIQTVNLIGTLFHNMRHLSYFIKQFENKSQKTIRIDNTSLVFEKRRFYDEREWRYIPFEADEKDELLLPFEYYKDPDKREKANRNMEKYKLTFELDDIQNIIVSSRSQKKQIQSILKSLGKNQIKILKV